MRPVTLRFHTPSTATALKRPLLAWPVKAGFPSPADDYLEARIDLNDQLIRHPAATFFVRVSGDSMTGAGIQDGDLLIVDRAAEVTSGCIFVARVHDEFTLKRIRKDGARLFLMPENDRYPAIEVTESNDFEIWGRVTGSVREYWGMATIRDKLGHCLHGFFTSPSRLSSPSTWKRDLNGSRNGELRTP
jgi:DNA polymerase V